MRALVDLLREHEAFDLVLGQIRRDVHGRRLGIGRGRFDWLHRALVAHLELEEEQLLPVFDTLEHPVPNGSPEVIRRDHALIRGLLEQVRARFGDEDPVALCGDLGQLAGVLEHHDLREARYFKPRLDAELSADRVAAILEAHHAVTEAHGPPPDGEGTPGPLPLAPADPTPIDRLRWCLAVGELEDALTAASELSVGPGKGERLRQRVLDALSAREVLAAWDAARLLKAVLDAAV